MIAYEEDTYKEQAEEKAKKYKDRMYDINLDKVNANYNDISLYLKNAEDLYNSYTEKRTNTKKNAKIIHGEILINDRLSYYENESQETLAFWYSIFWYVYYLLVVVLFLGIILDRSGRSRVIKLILFLFAFFYPFLVSKMVSLKNKYLGVGGAI